MSTAPMRTADFISSHGVNTHINYNDGDYANLSNIVSSLNYLGIDRVRDSLNYPGQFGSPPISAYETVAKAGIKFTFTVGGGGSLTTTGGVPSNPSLDQRVGYIEQLARAVPGSIVGVEGTNEINNQPITYNGLGSTGQGQDELNAALAMQRDLYRMVHGSPDLQGVPVYHFTGEDAGTIPAGPDPASTPGLSDFKTQHPYPNYGEAPGYWVSRAAAFKGYPTQSGPAVYTETGYSSNSGTGGAVNLDVQAKYTLDLLLDAAKEGVSSVYLYELLDAYAPESPQGNAGWGLFDYNGNAKPVAVAMHNMHSILSDSGATARSFTPTILPYAVSGASPTGRDFAMAKSDGTQVIALWDEQPIWDAKRGVQLAPVTYQQTIKLGDGSKLYTVEQFDPMQGDTPVAVYKDISSVLVPLSDRPLFLSVKPTLTQAPTPVPVPVPVPDAGKDTLVLRLSEDAYQGNAQFTVSMDGKSLGPAQEVTALRKDGDSQEFTFQGDFGTGEHKVAVSFVNDAWGGTDSTDRNLYVENVTLNGALLPNAENVLYRNETVEFAAEAPDNLVLRLSEDAYGGNAQFTVSVDGKSLGPAQEVTALHRDGKTQEFSFKGDFGAGPRKVAVAFVNDAYAGTAATDRNLYVEGITLNGSAVPDAQKTLFSNGTAEFTADASDHLVLRLSEDAYLGHAQFTASVGGKLLGPAQEVTALRTEGKFQEFSFRGDFAAGEGKVAVAFVNDAWGGTASTDRNLYVEGVTLNGIGLPNAGNSLYSTGTAEFVAGASSFP